MWPVFNWTKLKQNEKMSKFIKKQTCVSDLRQIVDVANIEMISMYIKL